MNETEISKEIESIKERNRKVELDKAWELSWTRRLLILIGTYILAGVWLEIIKANNPWQNAFVPTFGYLLSTFTIPIVKKWWVKNR